MLFVLACGATIVLSSFLLFLVEPWFDTVAQIAIAHGMAAWHITDSPAEAWLSHTDWVLVGRSIPGALQTSGQALQAEAGTPAWTDRYNNLFRALRY